MLIIPVSIILPATIMCTAHDSMLVTPGWLVVVVVVGTIEQSNKLSSVIGHVTVIL